MAHDDNEEFEKAVSHRSVTTKTYLLAHKELLERYVDCMNAVNYDMPLVYQLQKLLQKQSDVLRAEYEAERSKQGLPSEVGWMSAR
jgi:hypothetical protein